MKNPQIFQKLIYLGQIKSDIFHSTFSFPILTYLFRHVKARHKDPELRKDPYLHKCSFCSKEFSRASNMERHKLTCKPANRTKPLNTTPVTSEDLGTLFASMSSCTQRQVTYAELF